MLMAGADDVAQESCLARPCRADQEHPRISLVTPGQRNVKIPQLRGVHAAGFHSVEEGRDDLRREFPLSVAAPVGAPPLAVGQQPVELGHIFVGLAVIGRIETAPDLQAGLAARVPAQRMAKYDAPPRPARPGFCRRVAFFQDNLRCSALCPGL